ncbi:hypothetical protein [Caminibacter sp.]
MFNVKLTDFLTKLTKNRKEQKYLKKLLYKISNDKDRQLIHYFLDCSSFEDIKKFLLKQNLIEYTITPEDFEKDFNSLKEKIAFELNEALLKKYS